MLIQRLNRSDPEKVFIVVKNSYSTAAITSGQPVCFDYTTDADGVGVTRPTTALLPLFAGIVDAASIAAGSYGLIQVYGHNANALVDGTSGLAVGDQLMIQNNSFDIAKETQPAVDSVGSMLTMGEAYSTGAAAAKKAFIRAL